MKLKFLGAAECVTGSKYLLTTKNHRVLVDCGLFQGEKELRLRNWAEFPVPPKDIDAVILTHAHLDHSGYLPLLVKNGFTGKIYCTPATFDLCSILLPDSGYLQEEYANLANRKGFSKHAPALPLYTKEDAIKSLASFETINFNKPKQLFPDFTFQFNYAGHILGAATVLVKAENISILFSGDLGRSNDDMMYPPKQIEEADYLLIESTYGKREHVGRNPKYELADIINQTAKQNGTILVPAFAVGRAQKLLHLIHDLKVAHKIPDLPVFLDSPMAIDATEIFLRYPKEHKLSAAEAAAVGKTARYINSVEESKALDIDPSPKIIISASGMAAGGRVLHHIKTYAPDEKNSILFAGFQASGTRGDLLVNKGKKEIKLFGQIVPVNARIDNLENVSAHADADEIVDWVSSLKHPPKKVFIIHGEADAAASLCQKLHLKFNWRCTVPKYLQEEKLV
jgi:metallo-beta-lactamase family protein